MTWQPDAYLGLRPLAGPQIETSGLGHCLLEAGRRAEGSLPRQRPGKANCASSAAHGACGTGGNINTAGVYEVRARALYLFTSSAKPARAKRGTNGDLWLRYFDACDSKPYSIFRVTRVWRSHLTAKELHIGCSTLFDMRVNTFADEMAGRAATRAEVLPQYVLAGQPMPEFLPPRTPAHRKTRQQKRHELLENFSNNGARDQKKMEQA